MLKLIGIAGIFFSCTMFGIMRSRMFSQRIKMLSEVQSMLDKLSTALRFQAMTVYELLDMLSSDSTLSRLEFLLSVNTDVHTCFSESWKKAVLEWSCPLSDEEKQLIVSVGNDLGGSDIDGQLSALSLHSAQLSLLMKKAEKECETKEKLYRSLGVLVGAFVSIMLI